ncbi:MAG: hypothetical protein IT555_18865 [Acetobacteraceae bacterium]|nr:hypothetical protein [Acetobacteraceae bacterium]
MWRSLALLLPLVLAACGALPRPFEGRPGSLAARLVQPPPARLAVAAPAQALLTSDAAAQYAAMVAEAMREEALPAVAEPVKPGDWQLELLAELRGGEVVPGFRVRDPAGAEKGHAEAAPVPAAAWQAAAPETLRRAGRQAAPTVAALLAGIEAARRDADPDSLVNRPVRVHIRPVVGAPGDGNRSLARQMRDEIAKLGMVVQEGEAGADYVVAGAVSVADAGAGQQRVEIRWQVTDGRGAEAGQVAQLNQVPRGTLAGLWADVAMVVAQEAAGGVRDVIRNQTGVKR